MKYLIPVLSLAFMLSACGSAFGKADIVDLYMDAVMTGNVEQLEKILAPNYWNIGGNGHIRDKEHFIQEIKDKNLVVDRITISNLRETKVGETRLLTGNGVFRGKALIPRPQGLMRYTMVIAVNNGEEQVVLFQTTPVIETKECPDGNCKIK